MSLVPLAFHSVAGRFRASISSARTSMGIDSTPLELLWEEAYESALADAHSVIALPSLMPKAQNNVGHDCVH